MGLLDAFMRGATAILKPVYKAAITTIRDVLREIDETQIGKAVTSFISGAAARINSRAEDLAKEEEELAAKRKRDGHQSEYDAQRQRDIEAERASMRAEMEAENAQKSAEELKAKADELALHDLDDDALSASLGLITHKECPSCHGLMRLRQGARSTKTGSIPFYWLCSNRPGLCPTIALDPVKERLNVIRGDNADLNTPRAERHAAWNDPATIQRSHSRLRGQIGESDEQIICPVHLLPMKLLPLHHGGGRLLDNYAYFCLGVTPTGHACDQQIKIEKMPQVAATLKRTEGKGIL